MLVRLKTGRSREKAKEPTSILSAVFLNYTFRCPCYALANGSIHGCKQNVLKPRCSQRDGRSWKHWFSRDNTFDVKLACGPQETHMRWSHLLVPRKTYSVPCYCSISGPENQKVVKRWRKATFKTRASHCSQMLTCSGMSSFLVYADSHHL